MSVRGTIACVGLALAFGLGGWAFAGSTPSPVKESDYRSYPEAQVQLGQKLFYDRVLSGTFRVSCATCHNHDRAGSNGVPLPSVVLEKPDDFATGGLPLYDALKPSTRHAPALFNLGATEFTRMFSDGRVVETPRGLFAHNSVLPGGLKDVLAAQALFPAVTGDELVGSVDSEVKEAASRGQDAIWEALAARVRDLPDYWPLFEAAFPDLEKPEQITISHIANGIGAFVGTEWRADSAPFDGHLRGDKAALSGQQVRGMALFYGKANCSSCHSGPFQTDHGFHGTGMPLWRFDEPFDTSEDGKILPPLPGRGRVTGKVEQRYHFRTPSLRNVAATAPYGWAGSHENLADFVADHMQPEGVATAFVAQRIGGFSPPDDLAKIVDRLESAITIKPVSLSPAEQDDLLAFLDALTDKAALKGRLGKPDDVPSSLALD
ncbi:MAG: cytochrome c peroxidase [Pseudomonadota bacterium]